MAAINAARDFFWGEFCDWYAPEGVGAIRVSDRILSCWPRYNYAYDDPVFTGTMGDALEDLEVTMLTQPGHGGGHCEIEALRGQRPGDAEPDAPGPPGDERHPPRHAPSGPKNA